MKDQFRSRTRAVAALTVGAALSLVLAGCGGGGDGGPVTPLTSSSPTTSTASPTTTTPAGTTPGQQKVLAANAVLGSALLRLATTTHTIQTDNGAVPTARARVTTAANSARNNLKSVRAAAYGSGKSCSSVLSHASAARSAAGQASSANGGVRTALNRLRADVTRLDAAVAVVRIDLTKLQAAVKATPDPPTTVTTAEVAAAVAGAVSLHKATVAFIGDAGAKSNSNVSAAAKAAATASSVAGKAC
jgi:hypothetical protein